MSEERNTDVRRSVSLPKEPRTLGSCGICGAKLPHATDAESLARANAVHDAYDAVEGAAPRAVEGTLREAAIEVIAATDQYNRTNGEPHTQLRFHNAMAALRAALSRREPQ